jgi:sugar phosphate permease
MVFLGLLVLGAGFLFFWRVQHLWMFYAAFMVMSLGHSLGGWVPVTTVLNNWFDRHRAKAMGWSNTVSRLGGLLLVPALAFAIDPDQDRLGWELAALSLGIFTLLIAWPLSQLIRDRPEDYGELPDGDLPASSPVIPTQHEASTPPANEPKPRTIDFTATQVLRTPAFWFISLGHGFTSMVIIAIMAHLGLLMKDQGFDVQTTGWVISVYSGVSMASQVFGGYVGDRIPLRIAIFIFTTIQAAAVLLLTAATTISMVYLFAVLFGIGFGGRNPLTTAIRGDYFGRASFGKILGISTVPMNFLLLIAPPLAGYMRDVQGTYTMAFNLLAALSFFGGFLFLMARKPELSPAS